LTFPASTPSCSKCKRGLLLEQWTRMASLPFEEWVEYPDAFCDCEQGRRAWERAQVDRQTHEEILRRHAQEVEEHRLKMQGRRHDRSGIPEQLKDYSLKRFFALAGTDHAAQTPGKMVLALAQDGFVSTPKGQKRYGLLVSGPARTGKTGLCVPFLLDAVRKGRETAFLDYLVFMRTVRDGYSDHTADASIDRAIDVDVLLLDNMGRLRATPTEHTLTVLDEILNQRAVHQRITLVTTRLAPAEFAEQFGDSIAEAVRRLCVTAELKRALVAV